MFCSRELGRVPHTPNERSLMCDVCEVLCSVCDRLGHRAEQIHVLPGHVPARTLTEGAT